MRAYVLVNVQPGKVNEVVAAISQLAGVKRVDACWGVPDIFAYVDTASERALNELVIDRIGKIEGVVRTETHIVVG